MNSRLSQWSLGVYPSKTSVWKFYNLRQMFSGKYRLIGRLRLVSMMAKARYVSEAENKQVLPKLNQLKWLSINPFWTLHRCKLVDNLNYTRQGFRYVECLFYSNLFYLGQLRGKCKPLLAISTAVKNVVYIPTWL